MAFSLQCKYSLLLWYHNERNCSIQSNKTIVNPKKDYMTGMLVVAKFQGKPYPAAIVGIADEKESLLPTGRKLEQLLKDDALSAFDVLKTMGVDVEEKHMDTCRPKASDMAQPSPMKGHVTTAKTPVHVTTISIPTSTKTKVVDHDEKEPVDLNHDLKHPSPSTCCSVEHLEKEVKSLRKKVKRMERKMEEMESKSTTSSIQGATALPLAPEVEIEKAIDHLSPGSADDQRDVNEIIRRATMTVFTTEELVVERGKNP